MSEAVDSALHKFWKQGYQGTSIPDLLEATGLERGSLYKAFGDKHSLFERAIGAYLRSGRAAMETDPERGRGRRASVFARG